MAEMTQGTQGLPLLGGSLSAMASRDNPWLRQLAMMFGIAASVALGVAVVLWSQSPSYTPLYGQMGDKDAIEVAEMLRQSGTPFRIDQTTGMLLVESSQVQELRMRLAAEGLPRSSGMGFEMLQQDTGFGTSRLVENARYHHALEGELARTISTIASVQTARVHLALPKQSVFVRQRKQPTASVVLRLHPGRTLERPQVDAIVHMVASSIPEMEAGSVTVVDHKGRMLSDKASDEIQLSSSQFEYSRKVEEHFRTRIEELLTPILGRDKVQAQVTADIDFTVTEQTAETFDPEQVALRSEQVNENVNRMQAPQGVPGALTNQPPAAANAPQNAAEAAAENGGEPVSSSSQATRNYEVDRVVSHTRRSPVSLRRLSIAVVVDDRVESGPEGQLVRRERTPEELDRLTQLVREAVGFDEARGDSVKVMNSSFMQADLLEPLPEPPLWEQPWFLDLVKQVGGLLVVLILIFAVLRPSMRRLAAKPVPADGSDAEGGATGDGIRGQLAGVEGAGGAGGAEDEALMLGSDGDPIRLPGPGHYENVMEAARQLVDEDPKRVAQLVKTWIAEDAR